MNSFFQKIKTFVVKHKFWTAVIVIVIIGGGYYYINKAQSGATVTTYSLTSVQKGTVITTVTGTGQVSANDQATVDAQVAGTIDAIDVSVGQHVTAGQTLAHIDSTSAQQSLQSAQIAYNQLVEPAKASDIQNDENSLQQSYASAFSDISNAFVNMPTIKNGLNTQLSDPSGYLSDLGQNENLILNNPTGNNDYETASNDYGKAINLYTIAYNAFQIATANNTSTPATSTIADLLSKTLTASSAFSQAASDANILLNFIIGQSTAKNQTNAATVTSDLQSWSSTLNSEVTSLGGDENSITSNENSLSTLIEGADALQVQAQQLSLTEAEQNYAYENVVAPFDGTVALISATPAEQVSNGTAIATVVTTNEYATISLNEVDAAKVSTGQKATLTFDAINNLSIAGTVSEVDGVGTVSQGVVTYNVKIAFDSEDARVKPGMSVNASIITAADQNVMIVPSSAVKTQGNMSYVQELGQKYTAAQESAGVTSVTAPKNFPVTVGLSDNTNTEIVSGLSVGDQVITKTTVSSASAASTKSAATAATARTTGGGGGFGGGGGASVLRAL